MNEDKLEAVTRRLGSSQDLRNEISERMAGTKAPLEASFVAGLSSESVERVATGADRLESLAVVDQLEAIVRRVGRPPLIVRNDQVELEPLPEFPANTPQLIKNVEPAVLSVGRVEFQNYSMTWGGTGWVIDGAGNSRVVATNRHVAKLVARRIADGRGVFMRNPVTGALYRMSVDFKEEVDSLPGDAATVAVAEVIYLADDTAPDVALVRIDGMDLPDPLPLAAAEAKTGDLVALIGYPAYDPRNDAGDQARYFKDLYEVKRFAPGMVTQALSGSSTLSHDCTSLGGNSGSPLISLDSGQVVGLHFAGIYGVNNSAVGVGTLRDLVAGRRPVAVTLAAATASESVADGVTLAAALKGRKGYSASFLGTSALRAPWPGLPDHLQSQLARPSDATTSRPFELKYTHFGVLFAQQLRQPVLTAVNIDGGHWVKIKRDTDKWFRDARIPLDDQLGRADFADLEIDRGHMVRREDPNWDPEADPGSEAPSVVATLANDDTFHYTNAAPQHSRFNQGKQVWQGIENYILGNARTKGFKACVFTAPVIRADDEEIAPGVPAPQEFWKLVVMVDADRKALHATAYLLSQGQMIRDLLEKRSKTEGVEGFVLGEYRTFQIAVRDLAEASGYDLSAYEAADPLARTAPGEEAIANGEPTFVPLTTLDEIVT